MKADNMGYEKSPFHEIVLLNVFPIYSIIFCDIIPRFDRKSLFPILDWQRD